MSGTDSARTGGSWRVNCPSGISGPRLRAGRRNSTTLKEENLRFTDFPDRAEYRRTREEERSHPADCSGSDASMNAG
ncbi:hypothetical protein GCM10010342_39700 [Streptomyces anulatus]|nr:hypothetical protein GCM10010342_39700 [Streptomyces anulatus]